MPKSEVHSKSKLTYSTRKEISCDEEYKMWLEVDWKNQSGEVEINSKVKIICFDSELTNLQRPIFPPTSSVFLNNQKIGDLAWFQPMDQGLGWDLNQYFDWMPVGVGFLSELEWSGDYEKTRERVRLLVRQKNHSDTLHSRIVSMHQELAEVGRVGLLPTTWEEIDEFAQTDLRHLIVTEGGRVGGGSKTSFKSEKKTVYYDTQSLRVPLILFTATMLLEYLSLEEMF